LQVPTVTSVTLAPETVQTLVVVEAKLTARPEEAVALTVNGGELLSDWFASVPKLIVWLAFVTVKLRLTGVAAA